MKRETILVIHMRLFLVLLFLVVIAGEPVETAMLPEAGREESSSYGTDLESGLPEDLSMRE